MAVAYETVGIERRSEMLFSKKQSVKTGSFQILQTLPERGEGQDSHDAEHHSCRRRLLVDPEGHLDWLVSFFRLMDSLVIKWQSTYMADKSVQ